MSQQLEKTQSMIFWKYLSADLSVIKLVKHFSNWAKRISRLLWTNQIDQKEFKINFVSNSFRTQPFPSGIGCLTCESHFTYAFHDHATIFSMGCDLSALRCRRPNDLTFPNWSLGSPPALVVSIRPPLWGSLITQAAEKPVVAALMQKSNKLTSLINIVNAIERFFYPFSMETSVYLKNRAKKISKEWLRVLWTATLDTAVKQVLYFSRVDQLNYIKASSSILILE